MCSPERLVGVWSQKRRNKQSHRLHRDQSAGKRLAWKETFDTGRAGREGSLIRSIRPSGETANRRHVAPPTSEGLGNVNKPESWCFSAFWNRLEKSQLFHFKAECCDTTAVVPVRAFSTRCFRPLSSTDTFTPLFRFPVTFLFHEQTDTNDWCDGAEARLWGLI